MSGREDRRVGAEFSACQIATGSRLLLVGDAFSLAVLPVFFAVFGLALTAQRSYSESQVLRIDQFTHRAWVRFHFQNLIMKNGPVSNDGQ